MTPSTAISRKRKQPPTFQHLPIERAKKLKKDWVEKKKIKSKWRHEKQKDGLGSTSQIPVQEQLHDPNSPAPDSDAAESDDLDAEDISDRKFTMPASLPENVDVEVKPSSTRQLPRTRSSQSSLPRSKLPPGNPRKALNSRGRGRGAGLRGPTRGRGKQPDMRTKMGDLLAKIQKNHASH